MVDLPRSSMQAVIRTPLRGPSSFTSAHPHIGTSAHLHIRTSAHPHIRTARSEHLPGKAVLLSAKKGLCRLMKVGCL